MFKSRLYTAIMAAAVVLAGVTTTRNEVYAADRGGRAGRMGMNQGGDRPELMRQMNMMGKIQADELVDNLEKEWRTTILADETVAQDAGEKTVEGIAPLQKEQALIRLSLENLEEKSELIEEEAFNSSEVATAFQAAISATEAYYEKLEADPEYAKLKVKNETATGEINAFRKEMQLNQGNRREIFDKWRENAGAIRELEETIQETRRLMVTFIEGDLELQKLQNKKTESWIAFEKVFIEVLKNNEEYVTILRKLERLGQWDEKLQDAIEVEYWEARRKQRFNAAEPEPQPVEVDPEVEADPLSVF